MHSPASSAVHCQVSRGCSAQTVFMFTHPVVCTLPCLTMYRKIPIKRLPPAFQDIGKFHKTRDKRARLVFAHVGNLCTFCRLNFLQIMGGHVYVWNDCKIAFLSFLRHSQTISLFCVLFCVSHDYISGVACLQQLRYLPLEALSHMMCAWFSLPRCPTMNYQNTW